MDIATISLQDAGIRKAAILVASIDRTAADLLLEQLGPERAQLVRHAVTYLDDVAPAERRRVVAEFRRIGPMTPGRDVSGIELDRLPANPKGRAFRPSDPAAPKGGGPDSDATTTDAPPFDFLRGAENEKLADLLGGERPQTVALVLSHLPPERAAETLSRLPPTLQVDVVRRLVDLENTDEETLRGIEQALEVRWSRQFAADRRRALGPETVANILGSCNGKTRGRILENLASHDPSLAERLGDRPMAFDDFAKLSGPALLAVYRVADPEVALAALLGAPPAVLDRLLRCMVPVEAKQWRHQLDHPGPIRLSDIEEAQRQIAVLAQRLAREKNEAA
jgi:flagellar motor switch protein FliG